MAKELDEDKSFEAKLKGSFGWKCSCSLDIVEKESCKIFDFAARKIRACKSSKISQNLRFWSANHRFASFDFCGIEMRSISLTSICAFENRRFSMHKHSVFEGSKILEF